MTPTTVMKRSAGVVVVHHAHDVERYLLLRAYRYWDFPKGLVEPGESPLTAAIREVREETGIDALEFRWGHDYIETEPYAGGKVARYYVAHTNETQVTLGINRTLGRPEHQEFRWLDYAAAHERLVPRVQNVLDWASRRIRECT